MSYRPPHGGYPGYGPPSGAPYGAPPPGPAPYGVPPQGPTLGFENLTIGPPGGTPGYPAAGPMPMPGQGPSGYGPPGTAPYMPTGPPQPAAPYPGGHQPGGYPHGQPPTAPLSFGAAAMATAAFPGHRTHSPAGPPMPVPGGAMPGAPHPSSLPNSQLYGGMPRPPAHGGMPTAPPHGGMPTAPPHGGMPTAPPHGGMPTAPPHGGMPTAPPHGGMRSAPPHGGMRSAPPHGSMPTAPPHGGMPSAPPHGGMPSAPPSGGMPTPSTIPAPSAPVVAAPKASSSRKPRGRPSVTEHAPFDPEQDADVLRKAMKGLGCDSKAIIFLLCSRTNAQRQRVERAYKTMHGRNLIDDLKSELGGHFEDVVLALMMPPAEFDATLLRKAIKGLGTDEEVLIEVLCSRTNAETTAIKEAYKRLYDRDLEKDVAGDTSGHFKKFLISLLQANRDESDYVDRAKAQADAQALYSAGEKRWGTDESKFNTILVSRSFPHLRAAFEEYSRICKYDIQESIKREMSGDLRDGMITIVQIVRDTPTFFAEKLYKSMKGLGTDDKTLIRIVVTRSEVDLLDIKTAFQSLYHTTLAKYISDDTRGNYKKILLALLGSR